MPESRDRQALLREDQNRQAVLLEHRERLKKNFVTITLTAVLCDLTPMIVESSRGLPVRAAVPVVLVIGVPPKIQHLFPVTYLQEGKTSMQKLHNITVIFCFALLLAGAVWGTVNYVQDSQASLPQASIDVDFVTTPIAGSAVLTLSEDGYPILKNVGPNAKQAGLRDGDVIIAIGKKEVKGLDYWRLSITLNGAVGFERVSFRRPGADGKPIEDHTWVKRTAHQH